MPGTLLLPQGVTTILSTTLVGIDEQEQTKEEVEVARNDQHTRVAVNP